MRAGNFRHLGFSRQDPVIAFRLLACLALTACVPFADAPVVEARYEPSPPEVVNAMLQLANVTADDVVYDLGCGDGRIVIEAVRRYGARGVCVDIDPQRIREARANAAAAGVLDKLRFRQEDLQQTELREATVVTLFLTFNMNLKLRPRLERELRPGTRIVSHWHTMGDWPPERMVSVQGPSRPHPVYLWVLRSRESSRGSG